MQNIFGLDYYGKNSIVSRHGICDSCRRLTTLSSYNTERFLHLRRFPLIPLGRSHIVEECPHCGNRGITSNHKYQKQRKKDLAEMMEGFTSEADNPDTALHGLQTLMVYNEESWFMDVLNSYGRRFYSHMQIQLVLAQGLCRFGHYEQAEIYCRTAIVLGAGPRAEELLTRCQTLREKSDQQNMQALCAQPESLLRPYAFVIAVGTTMLITLVAMGASALRNHTAWLVSGCSIPYSVEIDGNAFRLKPYGVERITLRLGNHLIQTHGLPGHNNPDEFSYKTSLIKQKFSHYALVINPDAMAVLVTESRRGGQTTNDYLFGETINAMAGIDYPFSSFSKWVGNRRSAQTRLFLHIPTNHLDIVELLRAQAKPAEANEYVRRALATEPSDPDSTELLGIAISDLSTAQAAAFLRRGKSATPPLLNWHIFYQNFMEAQQPDYDMQTEYALLCESFPDTPIYFYLLARVVTNPADAKLLFEKSEQGQGCNGLGYNAIAYDFLCSGDFAAALPYSEKALACSPEKLEFQTLNTQINLALQQYVPLLEQHRKALAADPNNGTITAQIVRCLTLLGEHQKATETIANFQPAGNGESLLWGARLNAERFYAVGNAADYIANLMESGAEDANLQKLLHAGEIESAQVLLNQNKDPDYAAHLILYSAARFHGYPAIANEEWTKAIASIGSQFRDQRATTVLLSSQAAPTIKQLIELRILPQEKAILCTALGFRFPEQQDAYFTLARKFNIIPEYPYLLLKKWMRPPQQIP